jgi:tripartite-type tricarboxylate transporter receptor subunit TctC
MIRRNPVTFVRNPPLNMIQQQGRKIMTIRTLGTALGLTGALALVAGISPASADAISDFYKGKRLQMLVGSAPGGGYDTYARLITRHISRYIPGNPKFITKNMDGAGSIVVMNFVANVAPKDGTVIAGLQRNLALVQIMGTKGPQFKAQDINWLGSLANEAGVCAVDKRVSVKKFDETFTKVLNMAGTGPNDTEIQPALFNNTLGTVFSLIKGYPSTAPAHLAIQRGEVDGICQSWSSFKVLSGKYYEDGNMVPLVQMSLKPNPELSKMGVPMIYDYITKDRVKGGLSVDQVTRIYNLIFASKAMGRPFAMGPGVPKARVKAIRAAFNAMAKDAKFLADAKRQKRDVELVTGEEIQEIVAKMAATPKAELKLLEDLQKYKGKAKVIKVAMVKHTGKVTQTKRGGRRIYIDHKGKEVRAKVSGSRTAVTLNGKKVKRKAIKVGMTCTFTYPGAGQEAKKIDCKG